MKNETLQPGAIPPNIMSTNIFDVRKTDDGLWFETGFGGFSVSPFNESLFVYLTSIKESGKLIEIEYTTNEPEK